MSERPLAIVQIFRGAKSHFVAEIRHEDGSEQLPIVANKRSDEIRRIAANQAENDANRSLADYVNELLNQGSIPQTAQELVHDYMTRQLGSE